MAKQGPIIAIEDDVDDKEILEEIIRELGYKNEFVWFTNGPDAFRFLQQTPVTPFIILSDINLPGQTGLDLKRQIDQDAALRRKAIPFVFFSTSVSQEAVNQAYMELTIQGFFQKSLLYDDLKHTIALILQYWTQCRHVNSFIDQ